MPLSPKRIWYFVELSWVVCGRMGRWLSGWVGGCGRAYSEDSLLLSAGLSLLICSGGLS